MAYIDRVEGAATKIWRKHGAVGFRSPIVNVQERLEQLWPKLEEQAKSENYDVLPGSQLLQAICSEFAAWLYQIPRVADDPMAQVSSSYVTNDVDHLRIKDAEYGGSWQLRGGPGAFFAACRKWDRYLESVRRHGSLEKALADDSREEGIRDDLGDLRRYLILWEAWRVDNEHEPHCRAHPDNRDPDGVIVQSCRCRRSRADEKRCGAPTGTHGRDECQATLPCAMHGPFESRYVEIVKDFTSKSPIPTLPQHRGWVQGSAAQEDARDARRYRRLRVLGVGLLADGTDGRLLTFTNLDEFVDADLKREPSRGEVEPESEIPVQRVFRESQGDAPIGHPVGTGQVCLVSDCRVCPDDRKMDPIVAREMQIAATRDHDFLIRVAAATKHGPSGRGGRGDCSPGCVKCEVELMLKNPRDYEIRESSAPIPMRLVCPRCSTLHLDVGEFATKPHHTHACQQCGEVWRPAIVATVGVQFLPGFKNE